jgi:hypothetical protein
LDFLAYREKLKKAQPKKWTDRQRLLNARDLALDGKLYDDIPNAFTREFRNDHSDERISLDDRRSAAQYQLPRIVARGFVNKLFGEGYRPVPFVRNDDVTNAWISAFIKDTRLWWHLYNAAYQGQSGSVAIVLRVLAEQTFRSGDPKATQGGAGRFHIEVWPAVECSPVFKAWSPTEVDTLERTYFVKADNLRARGYDVEAIERKWQDFRYGRTAAARRLRQQAQQEALKPSEWWAMRLRLERRGEAWFEPIPKWLYDSDDFDDRTQWPADGVRSFQHDIDDACVIWIVNAPDRDASFPDGMCTFEPTIDFQFRIDRTISQVGRAFDYAGDPQVAEIEGKAGSSADGGGDFDSPEEQSGATASDTLRVPPGGDIKFLEIQGDGLRTAIETYVKELRQIAREVAAASRIDPDTAGRDLSGAAMKRLDDAMLGVLGLLRLSYGDGGLEPLLRLGMRLYCGLKVRLPSFDAMLTELLERRKRANEARKSDAQQNGEVIEPSPIDVQGARPNPDAFIETKWPQPYAPTGTEKQAEVSAAASARDGKVITQETAVANVAGIFDVSNPDQELADIQAETAIAEERELELVEQHAKINAAYTITTE